MDDALDIVQRVEAAEGWSARMKCKKSGNGRTCFRPSPGYSRKFASKSHDNKKLWKQIRGKHASAKQATVLEACGSTAWPCMSWTQKQRER